MNFNGSGGLLILGFVAVWVIVFMPSIGKKKQGKNVPLNQRQERLATLREQSSPELTKAASKAKVKSRLLLVAAAAGSAVSIFGLFQGSLVLAVSGVSVGCVFVIAARAITISQRRKVQRSANRSNKVSGGLTGVPVADIDEIGEQPGLRVSPVPAQLYRQVATLEEVTLADVVEIELPRELERETLDEILRRRRAN